MFKHVDPYAGDPILSLNEAFQKDPRPHKINLSIGIYFDDAGRIPVLESVRRAEAQIIAADGPKPYQPIEGAANCRSAVQQLLFGAQHEAVASGRIATIQSVGSSGSLRVGAEFIHRFFPASGVWVSDPTWDNHRAMFEGAGLLVHTYPYYDNATGGLRFDALLETLRAVPRHSVVLLHACCHNPTGTDLQPEQWSALAEVIENRGLMPFVDLAYQGFGDDLGSDVVGLRILARRVPEFLLAISCSKNFGLYRERAGALAVIARSGAAASAVATHQARIARRMYSMPPDHGAAIAARVLGEAVLRSLWEDELKVMVGRMKALRALLAGRLAARRPGHDFGWLTRQRGMFSLLGLDAAGIAQLRDKHHVYVPPDGRINVAGINEANVDYVAEAVAGLIA